VNALKTLDNSDQMVIKVILQFLKWANPKYTGCIKKRKSNFEMLSHVN
jgi:hypothetical protein